jgi:hypothetical protein
LFLTDFCCCVFNRAGEEMQQESDEQRVMSNEQRVMSNERGVKRKPPPFGEGRR